VLDLQFGGGALGGFDDTALFEVQVAVIGVGDGEFAAIGVADEILVDRGGAEADAGGERGVQTDLVITDIVFEGAGRLQPAAEHHGSAGQQ